MLHPSYNDLMNVVNSDVEPGEHPVVNSRYSMDGSFPKPLSVAIEELSTSAIKINSEEDEAEEEEALAAVELSTAEDTESTAQEETEPEEA